MYRIKLLIFSIIFLLNLNAKELDKVSLQLDWLHQFQFAGYYIAKEKGYFQEENLDVNIKEFDFGINLLEDVLNSKSEYAVGKSSLIIDKLDGKEVVLLAAIYQNSPMVLISLKKSNINSPLQLKDKKVMLTPDARSAASINSMIISQGLQLKDINFQPHSFKLDDLINGTTDAMGCYLSNEPYILEQKGIEFTVHNPSEYGFNFYGGLLFTSLKELNENPIRVRSMYKAVMRGWEYAFNNVEETAKIIFEKYNTQKKTLNSLIFEGYALKKLAKHDEGKLGQINIERIEEIKRLYLLLGLSKNTVDFKLNSLIYDVKKINLTQKEKDYLKNNDFTLLSNTNYPPFTIVNENKLSGIEIDYFKLINKKLGENAQIETFEKNKNALKQIKEDANNIKYAFGKYDLEDKNTITSSNISSIKIALATLIDKDYISDLNELTNKKIAIVKYSSIYKEFKKSYPFIDFVETKNLDEALKKLNEKKVYGVVSKLPALTYNIKQNSFTNMKISGIFDKKFNLRLLINRNNQELQSILNKTISTITKEERDEINNKYFSIVYEEKTDYSWAYRVFFLLSAIILIILVVNRKLKKEIKKRKVVEEELFKVANIDALTNVYNRRKIETLYESELQRVKRYKRDLSIIFFDIDNFKLVNDELGHHTGDEVLIRLASVVKNNIRKTDCFGRWGGEEFVIILPETSKEQASNIAYLLKSKINSTDFNINRDVTCSFGVAQFEETDSADSLLTRADNAMYYIKRNGKNSVKVV